MFYLGEELEYSVHYSFFNIGTIRFKVTNKEERNGRTVYRAYAFMDSNPSLGWLVDLHVKFYSEIDEEAFSYGWVSEDSTRKKISIRRMKFDYERRIMHYDWGEKTKTGEVIIAGSDTVSITSNCQDGLSLFFFARENAQTKKQMKIPTFIDTNEVMTEINFGVQRMKEEIDVVNYPIDVIKLTGKADFVGIFGLTGKFEGVFTNDIAGIPITARLKVILGSIRVELRKWSRGDWVPPKYTE